MDDLLKKLPGSTKTKAFGLSIAICTLLAVPVFGKKDVKQGHDLFSQEKPEAVRAGEERKRKLQRLEKDA